MLALVLYFAAAMAVDSKENVYTPTRNGVRMRFHDGKSVSLEDQCATPPLNGVKQRWAHTDDNILSAGAGNHLRWGVLHVTYPCAYHRLNPPALRV